MPRKLIYFDRNVYSDIKVPLPATTADYDLIKRGIALGIIMIPGSLAVIEEALPIYHVKSPTRFALEKQAYAELMDWKVFIKYHAVLLRDEIMAYVNNTPFTPFTSYNITPDDCFTTDHAQSKQLKRMLPLIEAEKNKLSEGMKDVRENFEKGIKGIPKGKRKQLTVSSLWQTGAKLLARGYASSYGLDKLSEPQIEGLLNLRSLGSVIRYDIAYYYRKIRLGEQIKASDSRDHHHVALSAATDIFITDDRHFAEILQFVPIQNYTVWSYKQFIKWLSITLAGWQAPDSYYARPWAEK
jgi:hypothetical protein